MALACPDLWSYISTRSPHPEWIRVLLERSKMGSLTVSVILLASNYSERDVMEQALGLIHRTKALTVCGLAAIHEFFAGAIISAPILRSLVLACRTSSGAPPFSNTTHRLPEPIMTGDIPSLRHVELVGLVVPWNSPFLLNGLTHLKIHQTPSSSRRTMAEIIAALETMPALETLDLKNTLPAIPGGVAVPERTIELSRLSLIAISARVPECAQFLRYISFPSTTSINLVCSATPETGRDFSSILSVFSRNGSTSTHAHEEPQIRTLYVDGHYDRLIIQGWTRAPKDKKDLFRNLETPIHAKVTLRWPGPDLRGAEAVVMDVCRALPLDRLQCLRLNFNLSDQHEWLANFGSFSNLQTLHVKCLTADGVNRVGAILQQ